MHGTFWRRLPLSPLPPPQFDLWSNNREGTHPCPSKENWIKDLLNMAPLNRTRPSFPLSLSHQDASISLLSSSIRGQTEWKPLGYHWKRLWCWEGLGAGGERDNRGWDGWMPSRTRWTWVWVKSRRWWWSGRPGVLQFMGSQRVGHDWAIELTN